MPVLTTRLSLFPAITALDDADLVYTHDTSATEERKITVANFKTSVVGGYFTAQFPSAFDTEFTSGLASDEFKTAARGQVALQLTEGSGITLTPTGTGATQTLAISTTPGGASLSRGSANTTVTVAAAATATNTITLPKSCTISSIETDKAATVVLYSSAAAATADAGRDLTTSPTAGTGVVCQITRIAGGVTELDPIPVLMNRESTPNNTYTVRVKNNAGTADVVVTIDYLSLDT
jgi:hypothetical protein